MAGSFTFSALGSHCIAQEGTVFDGEHVKEQPVPRSFEDFSQQTSGLVSQRFVEARDQQFGQVQPDGISGLDQVRNPEALAADANDLAQRMGGVTTNEQMNQDPVEIKPLVSNTVFTPM